MAQHDAPFVRGPGENLRIRGPGQAYVKNADCIERREPSEYTYKDFLVEVVIYDEAKHGGRASGPIAERS
jgi:hypothetical protein